MEDSIHPHPLISSVLLLAHVPTAPSTLQFTLLAFSLFPSAMTASRNPKRMCFNIIVFCNFRSTLHDCIVLISRHSGCKYKCKRGLARQCILAAHVLVIPNIYFYYIPTSADPEYIVLVKLNVIMMIFCNIEIKYQNLRLENL